MAAIKKIRMYITPHKLAILLFALFLLSGIFIYDDYGISWDEIVERETSLINYLYVMGGLMRSSDNESVQHVLNTTPSLTNWLDRHYGVFLQSITIIYEHIRNFEMDSRSVYLLRHAFTFFNYFIAGIFFYFILRRRFGNTYIPLIGVLFYIFSPRFFGGSFYNIKDMLFFSWLVISSYFVLRWLEDVNKKRFLILSAFTIAIATNTRILGISVLLLAGIFVFIQGIQHRHFLANNIKKYSQLCLLSFVFYVVITPFTWDNPIKNTIDTLFLFIRFNRWNARHFYLGEMITREVPWHYIPVWMGITIPILYILLFLTGVAVLSFFGIKVIQKRALRSFKEKLEDKEKLGEDTEQYRLHLYDIFFYSMFMFTLFGYIGLGVSMYEGWRHAYGIFLPFLYMTVYGMFRIYSFIKIKQKVYRVGFACIVIISLVYTSIWMVINHPYQYVYFNVIGRQVAEGNFALDYWGVSTNDVFLHLLRTDDRHEITVAIHFNNHFLHMLPPEHRHRIKHISASFAPDYIVRGTGGGYYFHEPPAGYEQIFGIYVDGIKINSLLRYKINHENFDINAYTKVLSISASCNKLQLQHIFDDDMTTAWETEEIRQKGDFVEIQFTQPVDFNIVRLSAPDEIYYADDIAIFLSIDGLNWFTPLIIFNNAVDYVFEQSEYKYIIIENLKEHETAVWSINEIMFGSIDIMNGMIIANP